MTGIRENIRYQRRATAGFTMVEALVAVALMVILMGVGFVAVQRYQRSLKQTELDGISREIFIAAQNHLTVADSQGILDKLYDEAGEPEGDNTFIPQLGYCHASADGNGEGAGSKSAHYYWFVPAGEGPSISQPNTLWEMLPYGSIDSVVRDTGSYVIEYDLKTATVISVFFSDQSNLSRVSFNLSAFETGEGDYSSLFSDFAGDNKSQNRLDGFATTNGGTKNVIGWYGGADLKGLETKQLYPPIVRIVNKEKLTVEVDFSELKEDELKQNRSVSGAKLNLILYGNTSKNTQFIRQGASLGSDGPFFDTSLVTTFVLDDITSSDKQHFVEKWCQGEDTSDVNGIGPLIPGEDITVYAEVYSDGTLARAERSNSSHSNSLFDSMDYVDGEEGDDGESGTEDELRRCIVVSNIRHLENLDKNISAYLSDNRLGTDATTYARQITDLKWSGADSFTRRIGGSPDNEVKVRIYYANAVGSDKNPTEGGSFAPVTPAALENTPTAFEYDGLYHSISGIKVEAKGDKPAGIFAELPVTGSSISNLEVLNSSVSAENGDAGTLLASTSVDKLSITNILVRDNPGDVKSTVSTSTAGKSAGGLIGKMTTTSSGDVKIDCCASSVLVAAEGANSYAGGLIGQAVGKIKITDSYVGGHTENALYDEAPINVDASKEGSGTAGGFVGYMKGGEIQYCYTTASASAKKAVGGFIGEAEGVSVTNSYATGLVAGIKLPEEEMDKTKHIGSFVGSADNTSSFSNNLYYSIINDKTRAIGTLDVNGDQITALDSDINEFKNDYFGEKGDGAHPYDSVLRERYGEKYPLLTVAQLTERWNNGNDSQRIKLKNLDNPKNPFFVTKHYGDYPDPITYVINTTS